MTKEQLSSEITKFKNEVADALIDKIQKTQEKGVTQAEIAEFLSITQPRLSNVINYYSSNNRDKLSTEWMLSILMKLSPRCFKYSFAPRFTVAPEIKKQFRKKKVK